MDKGENGSTSRGGNNHWSAGLWARGPYKGGRSPRYLGLYEPFLPLEMSGLELYDK